MTDTHRTTNTIMTTDRIAFASAVVDLARNIGATDDHFLETANERTLRATLRELRADAREILDKRPMVSPVSTAFSDLLVALDDNHPVTIIGEADSADMDERAEHVQRLLGDVETYLEAVLADAKHRTSGIKFDVNVMGILSDIRGDLVGTFRIAAEQMREFEMEGADHAELY